MLLALPGLVTFSVPSAAVQQDTAATERRALDPLTRDELARAESIARSDSKVKELLGDAGVRVVSAVPVIIKAESPEKVDHFQRQVEVVLFNPQREVGARVVVYLQGSKTLEVSRLTSDQVPFTQDDLADAFQLAVRDEAVNRALGGAAQRFHLEKEPGTATGEENIVTGLPVHSSDRNDPCSKHRCMELYFRRGTDYLSEPVVLVDLSAKRVSILRRK